MTCQRSAAFIRSLQGGPSRHIQLKVKEAIKVLSFPLKNFRSPLLSPQPPILARQVNLAKWKLKFKCNVITDVTWFLELFLNVRACCCFRRNTVKYVRRGVSCLGLSVFHQFVFSASLPRPVWVLVEGVRLRSLPWNTERLESFGERLVLSGSVQGSQNLGQEIILAQVPAGLWPLRESSNKGKLHLLPTFSQNAKEWCYWSSQDRVWLLLGGSESLFEFFNKMLWKNLLANPVCLLLGLKTASHPCFYLNAMEKLQNLLGPWAQNF